MPSTSSQILDSTLIGVQPALRIFVTQYRTIDVKSVEFHFKRGDFALWIRETLGDSELANEINRVSKTIRGEELRTAIHQTVDARLTKLKKLQASEEPYLERDE